MAKRRFVKGMEYEGKIISSVFRDGKGYMLIFTDKSWIVIK
jgi:hypothetical protein